MTINSNGSNNKWLISLCIFIVTIIFYAGMQTSSFYGEQKRADSMEDSIRALSEDVKALTLTQTRILTKLDEIERRVK